MKLVITNEENATKVVIILRLKEYSELISLKYTVFS